MPFDNPRPEMNSKNRSAKAGETPIQIAPPSTSFTSPWSSWPSLSLFSGLPGTSSSHLKMTSRRHFKELLSRPELKNDLRNAATGQILTCGSCKHQRSQNQPKLAGLQINVVTWECLDRLVEPLDKVSSPVQNQAAGTPWGLSEGWKSTGVDLNAQNEIQDQSQLNHKQYGRRPKAAPCPYYLVIGLGPGFHSGF